MLEINNLNAGYQKLQVLYNVDMRLPTKEITAIIGPNGSGKSTLLKSIFNLTTIYSGTIRYEGVNLRDLPTHKICREGLIYVPQRRNIFDTLTVKENLKMAYYAFEGSPSDKIRDIIERVPMIADKFNRKAETMSGGEKQMLAIGMALIREPRIIFFDEPTASLAPKVTQEVLDTLVDLRNDLGITVVFVEQNAWKALQTAERVYLLVGGKVAFEGTTAEFTSNRQLARTYLGLAETSPQ